MVDIWKAIDSKNVEMIREACAAGANLAEIDHHHGTPLHYAIQNLKYDCTNADSIGILLDAGAPIDEQDISGYTALALSISLRFSIDIIRQLLEHGANPNLATKDWYTPLMLVAYKCDPREFENTVLAAEILLAAGANVNYRGISSNSTALSIACHNRNVGLVLLLLKHGADPNLRFDEFADAPIHEALREMRIFPGYGEQKPATEAETLEIIMALVNAGAELIGPTRNSKETLVERAKKAGFIEVAAFLSDKELSK